MSRWLFPWSGSIKKRACRYLLQHYLGHFLQERLSLEQLSVDLYSGSGLLRDIHLDVWAVNDLLESVGAPLEMVDGFVSSIAVTIPWAALVTDHCTLVVTGLQLTCRPKCGGWDSQGWSSCMTSSMQLAQECLKDPPEASEEPPAPLEGLEMFAQTIETVLRRIKVTFLDTIVRIEHQPLGLKTGIALEVHIKRLDYCDEAVRDSSQTVPVDIHQPPAILHKILQLSAVQLFYENTVGDGPEPGSDSESSPSAGHLDAPTVPVQSPILIGSCSGSMETTVKIKQNDALPGPKLELDGKVGCLHLLLSPDQITHLMDMLSMLCIDTGILFLIILPPRTHLPSPHSFHSVPPFYVPVAEMFYSMGAGMSSSVMSARSGSELSDSDMESSLHSQQSLALPNSLSSGVRISVCVCVCRTQSEPLKPDALLRLSLGGVTVTLLEEEPPTAPAGEQPSLGEVSQDFFRELAYFKDAMFSGRDFDHLRQNFAKACPHSHLRCSKAAASHFRIHVYCAFLMFPLCFFLQAQTCDFRSSLTVLSPHAVLKIRFPIPDLRPAGQRRPPSQRAVRTETLSLELSHVELHTHLGPDPEPESAGTKERLLIIPFPCLFPFFHPGVYEGWEGSSFPCIRVQKNPDSQDPDSIPRSVSGLGLDGDLGSMSMESPCELRERESSPFSSNRTMFETEEMVIPADPVEMQEFQWQCVSQSQCVVDITMPLAIVLLPSKEAYQSLYNRINNDLLMWEPTPPTPPASSGSRSPSRQHAGSQDDEFRLCKSAFRLDSDSEEEDAQFLTARETLRHKGVEPRSGPAQSLLALTINIGKGRVQVMTDSKGETGRPVEHCHGELVLDVKGGKIFSVTQHQGNPYLNFLCLESKKVELYHKAVVPDSPIPARLEIPGFLPPQCLNSTIYPTEAGVSNVGGREAGMQMLSTAIKITLDLQKNVKEFLVALRLQGATLRHHMALTNHSWHEQLVDFLDVIDDPILGYTPPVVITVLHTHLATCAVDYRPLYLPLRVLFTAESFSLSSNIIVDTATFHLRFILDDSALYLSDKCESDAVDLRRDYVCVVDIDLLELAITTWKGSDSGKLTQPLFELRCSNNVVHLHTCADSCAALLNLLQYLVSRGDLQPPPRHPSPTEIAGQKLPLSESPATVPPCLPAETAEINQYDLTDALIDTEKSQREEEVDSAFVQRGSPVSVYLFPGEVSKHHPSVPEGEEQEFDGLVAATSELQCDIGSEAGSESSTDNDDFCILEAPGMGIPPRDGEPVVTVLCPGPVLVKDGYFSRPRGSSDLLRAPSRFPVPQSRVVLREVSVVWHLYGGKDFGGKPISAHAQHSHRGRPAPPGVWGSPSRSTAPPRPQNSWRWVGGSGRQHSLLMEIQLTKVSFQHESYPVVIPTATTSQEVEGGGSGDSGIGEQPLSRQVFIVQELEVRDRLATSQINKFLYLYTSESMPRRAHSNMLTVKALQVCPESGLGGPECCLRVSLLPLRLNIDQVRLMLKADPGSSLGADLSASMETTYSEHSSSSAGSSSSADQPIYFREFRFTSEVPIWLDYHGKHVVIEQGTFAGILIGLAQLNCSELKLKRLCCRHGYELLGVDKVIQYAVNEWLTDIRKNQLPGILGGVGPMHSVVQLFHGVRDLFWMPIEQYRKDGRIIRGIQRGAASFGTSTASAALELSNRLVQAIQATAETVYDILSPTPPLTRCIADGRVSSRPRRAAQPADLREGVAKAYDTVREGVIDTAQTLCDVASRGHEQKGLPGAVGGVLRQIPPTVVRPLIVASEATSNLLGGMRNQIKPDARKEDFLKWRTEDNQE
uniref:Autophagy related 2A n=1 Tax=Scleropages formosus TaxID=113540 RepID=A0A8C9TLP9_SCLFO